MPDMTPSEIVAELDKYIVGQASAPELHPQFEHGLAVLAQLINQRVRQCDVAAAGLGFGRLEANAVGLGLL